MRFMKRIFLFLAVNFLVVLAISTICSLLGIRPYLTARGLDIQSLMIFCMIWGMVGALISLSISRIIAKSLMGVKLVNRQADDPKVQLLYKLIESLSKSAGLPCTPQVGIFASNTMNAFATGPTKRRSLVAVSTGLLQRMQPHELEAVLAHEISHIANGDMVTMTLLQGVVNAFVMFLARILAYAVSGLGNRGRSRGGSFMSFYLLTFFFEMVFMVFGSMVVAFFSRIREYRADRGGAMLSGKENMIAALETLGSQRGNSKVPREQKALNAMMISPRAGSFVRLFATHPPIKKRIEALNALSMREQVFQ